MNTRMAWRGRGRGRGGAEKEGGGGGRGGLYRALGVPILAPMPTRRSTLPALLGLAAAGLAVLLIAGAGAAGAAVTVAPGDTLSAIAARNGTTVAAIAAANGIADPNRIVAGRRLTLPAAGAAPASGGGAASGGSYRVRSGDTLGAIAARHGTSVGALAALNGIADPNRIAAGRVLRVPAWGGGRPVGMASIQPGGPEVGAMITRAAYRHGVDPALARAVGWQESRWSQTALSHVGAIGVMQLMPETARWFGPAILGRRINPHHIGDNVEAGVAYIGWLLRQTRNERLAVGSYYQGLRATRTRGFYEDTKDYVASVMSFRGRV
jgi:N-acetylmuramoyl-L-alanine amidase